MQVMSDPLLMIMREDMIFCSTNLAGVTYAEVSIGSDMKRWLNGFYKNSNGLELNTLRKA
jgi:hypothetical protein